MPRRHTTSEGAGAPRGTQVFLRRFSALLSKDAKAEDRGQVRQIRLGRCPEKRGCLPELLGRDAVVRRIAAEEAPRGGEAADAELAARTGNEEVPGRQLLLKNAQGTGTVGFGVGPVAGAREQ